MQNIAKTTAPFCTVLVCRNVTRPEDSNGNEATYTNGFTLSDSWNPDRGQRKEKECYLFDIRAIQ
jgi:hypothetical protein